MDNIYKYREPTDEDLEYLARNMKHADRREVVGVVLRDLVHGLLQRGTSPSELRLDEEPERRDAEVDAGLDRTDRRRVSSSMTGWSPTTIARSSITSHGPSTRANTGRSSAPTAPVNPPS